MMGLNVNPLNFDHTPEQLASIGCRKVRLVLRPNLKGYLQGYQRAGIAVRGVLARESVAPFPNWPVAAAYYAWELAGLVEDYQIGNEMDQIGPSSWTLSPEEYTRLAQTFRDCQPQICGGLASGDPEWLTQIDTSGFRSIAVHPYSESTGIVTWLDRYRVFRRPIEITEWWPNEQATLLALRDPDVQSVYWWWHDPVDSNGWMSIRENPADIAAFTRCAEVHPMAKFQLGFKKYADEHPEVGEALSAERYFAPDVSMQVTTNGVLFYAGETNQVVFLPKE